MIAFPWELNDGVWERKTADGFPVGIAKPANGVQWTGQVNNGRDTVVLFAWPDSPSAEASKHHVDIQLERLGYLLRGEAFRTVDGDKTPALRIDRAQQDALSGITVTEAQAANIKTDEVVTAVEKVSRVGDENYTHKRGSKFPSRFPRA